MVVDELTELKKISANSPMHIFRIFRIFFFQKLKNHSL